MSVLDQIRKPDTETLTDPKFLLVIDDHANYLRTHSTSRMVEVSVAAADRAKHSLSRLLYELNVDYAYHHVIARVNGFVSTYEFDGTTKTLIIPDISEISKLIQRYRTTHKMI